MPPLSSIPTSTLGTTGVQVTRFGLGGEGVLRTWNRDREATALIRRALELGVTYFESARAYSGSESYLGAALGSDRERIFLTSKSAERTRAGALRDLEATLRNFRTEYVDLWQVHDVREESEWEQITGPGGALEAFEAARQAGKVRFLGVTGHHDPYLLARAVREYPFQTVLMPVNVAEAHLPGFRDVTLPAAQERGAAVIGMKVMGGGQLIRAGLPPALMLRWALSTPASVLTIGCGSVAELEENLQAVQEGPLSEAEAAPLLAAIQPHAERAAYYRGVL
jgi:aryl-alcohol dehydrogenase-like predicted oxidoreductase